MKIFFPFLLTILMISACTEENESAESEMCEEVPDENCACTYHYAPVCGCNGMTYGNSCAAECVGITNYTEGECQN